ncbi:MAG: sodium:calcium antiporter [Chitinophagales bacterium]
MEIIMSLFIIIVCCLIIWRASDGFETASEYLGRNLSDGVRGATINAIGSSMPELFTTLWFLFALENKDGFSGGIGTTAGSAIFNGMIIPAVVILAVVGYGMTNRVRVSKKVILRDGLSLIIAEILLILIISGETLYWWHGLSLMGIYGIYVAFMLLTMTKMSSDNTDEDAQDEVEQIERKGLVKAFLTMDLEALFLGGRTINSLRAWSLILASIAVIGGSCALLVFACEDLGQAMGIHTFFVAVVIASAATSVPDTIISYKDALKGQYDDAVANALGSNIFDICFALGAPLFLFAFFYAPIEMNPETVKNVSELWALLLILTIAAFLIYYIGDSMGRFKAFLLLGIYFVFTLYILASAYQVEAVEPIGVFLRSLLGM